MGGPILSNMSFSLDKQDTNRLTKKLTEIENLMRMGGWRMQIDKLEKGIRKKLCHLLRLQDK